MGPSLVVFDFDGTLAETREAVAVTVNGALQAHGWPRVAPEFVHQLMGLPLETTFERAVPPYRRPLDVAPMVAWYRAHFLALGAHRVTLLPEVREVLADARGRGLATAIATSREGSTLAPLLQQLGLAEGWTSVVSCDRVTNGKPAPDMLALAMAEAGATPARTWMVGDTRFDLEMAHAAGVRAIGVAGGCHAVDVLAAAGADPVLDDLGGLVALWSLG